MTHHERTQMARERAESARKFFQATFAATPDDRLTWSPGAPARNPLQLAYHIAGANFAFADILAGRPIDGDPNNDGRDRVTAFPDRATAVEEIDKSFAAMDRSLAELTEAHAGTTVDLGFATMPVAFFIDLSFNHPLVHTAQLDYLQTIYGDVEDHFPPDFM